MSTKNSDPLTSPSRVGPIFQVELIVERGQLFNSTGVPNHKILVPADVEILIGRGENCDLRFHPEQERVVSTNHCVVQLRGDTLWLTERQATNGTYLDGERIRGEIALRDGQRIMLGSIVEPEQKQGPVLRVHVTRLAAMPATIQVSKVPEIIAPQTLRMPPEGAAAPSQPVVDRSSAAPVQPTASPSPSHEAQTLITRPAKPSKPAPHIPAPPPKSPEWPRPTSEVRVQDVQETAPAEKSGSPAGSAAPILLHEPVVSQTERESDRFLKRQAAYVLGFLVFGCVLGLLIGTL